MFSGQKFSTHKMDVQVSHCIHTKVSPVNNLQTNQEGHTSDNKRLMQMERRKNNRRKHDAGSCAFVGVDTTKNECIKFFGVSEGKECDDDI